MGGGFMLMVAVTQVGVLLIGFWKGRVLFPFIPPARIQQSSSYVVPGI